MRFASSRTCTRASVNQPAAPVVEDPKPIERRAPSARDTTVKTLWTKAHLTSQRIARQGRCASSMGASRGRLERLEGGLWGSSPTLFALDTYAITAPCFASPVNHPGGVS